MRAVSYHSWARFSGSYQPCLVHMGQRLSLRPKHQKPRRSRSQIPKSSDQATCAVSSLTEAHYARVCTLHRRRDGLQVPMILEVGSQPNH